MKFLQDLFTERDGVSFCLGRIAGAAAIIEMIIKFADVTHVDYTGFAQGVAMIIAAIAAKNYTEKQ